MKKLSFVALIFGMSLGISVRETPAQNGGAQQESQEIAALFNKTKHKVKEKRGVRVEVYVDIKSEPFVKQNIAEYAGEFKADTGDWFTLKISSDGRIEASGSEPSPQKSRRFTVKDARIEGALLTGTKVYDDGAAESFEAVFLKRTVRLGETDAGTSVYGFGVRYDPPKIDTGAGFHINKLFYELK
ncbi:MAG TPA: hypothetical protein VF692_06125 [Pyrinomonadaceae bacterium]